MTKVTQTPVIEPDENTYYIVTDNQLVRRVNSSSVLNKVSVPNTSTSTGVANQIAFDSNYLYVCVSPNSWKRIALNNF
jgi:hypothetical protein